MPGLAFLQPTCGHLLPQTREPLEDTRGELEAHRRHRRGTGQRRGGDLRGIRVVHHPLRGPGPGAAGLEQPPAPQPCRVAFQGEPGAHPRLGDLPGYESGVGGQRGQQLRARHPRLQDRRHPGRRGPGGGRRVVVGGRGHAPSVEHMFDQSAEPICRNLITANRATTDPNSLRTAGFRRRGRRGSPSRPHRSRAPRAGAACRLPRPGTCRWRRVRDPPPPAAPRRD